MEQTFRRAGRSNKPCEGFYKRHEASHFFDFIIRRLLRTLGAFDRVGPGAEKFR